MDLLIKEGVQVDSIICDPPYGTTACKWDSVIPFDAMWERLNKLIKPNGAIVLFGSEPFSSALRMSNIKNYKYDWIWDKKKAGNFASVRYQPLKPFEIVSIFNKHKYYPIMTKGKMRKKGGYNTKHEVSTIAGLDANVNDLYYPKAILEYTKANNVDSKLHPTQKPVTLMEYLIKTYTNENETVLDFTMGSGSTGVACKNTGRDFIGIELDKGYYDIACKRIKEVNIETK
jgi:site-specific DNA-methyltransferase (adenine-specific)